MFALDASIRDAKVSFTEDRLRKAKVILTEGNILPLAVSWWFSLFLLYLSSQVFAEDYEDLYPSSNSSKDKLEEMETEFNLTSSDSEPEAGVKGVEYATAANTSA